MYLLTILFLESVFYEKQIFSEEIAILADYDAQVAYAYELEGS